MLRPMALSSTDPKTLGPTAPAQAARWVLSAAARRRSRVLLGGGEAPVGGERVEQRAAGVERQLERRRWDEGAEGAAAELAERRLDLAVDAARRERPGVLGHEAAERLVAVPARLGEP